MTENDPFEDAREKPRCTKVELRGPNVSSSFDRPPSADALKVQQATIRKHLQDHPQQGHPPHGRRPEGP
jgi:hypothetical protein